METKNFNILLCLVLFKIAAVCSTKPQSPYDPCCSYPCQHNSVCMSIGFNDYTCDCTGLPYYGKNCEKPTWSQIFLDWIKPNPDLLHAITTHFSWIWWIINNVPFVHNAAMKHLYLTRGGIIESPPLYNSAHDYITLDSHYNYSYYARSLPPVPDNCPTPLGTKGKKSLPDVDDVVNRLFTRKIFKTDPHGTNMLFAGFAQHFSHQFFKTDFPKGPAFTWGTEGLDCSHIYGQDELHRRALRSFKDGKLKTMTFNNDEYPPKLSSAPGAYMQYPKQVLEEDKYALGHPIFGMLPWLFAIGTVWMREHNRVCDIVKSEHPEWDDERIYQTARLIVIGETLTIVVEDYVQHLSQYNLRLAFKPELTHDESFQYSNRIRVEFDHLYRWHPFVPDSLQIKDINYSLNTTFFSVKSVFDQGLDAFITSIIHQRSGQLTHHNHNPLLLHIVKSTISHGRTIKLQSFNNYRRRFGMKPFKSFLHLTGDKELAKELDEMYGDIEGLEFFPGFYLEKPGSSVVTNTMVNIGGPYSVKGLLANPLCSPGWWKPSTFGGKFGMEIVKTASIKKLICLNLKSGCENGYVAFSVPSNPPWWYDPYVKGGPLKDNIARSKEEL